VDWTYLAQDRDQGHAVAYVVEALCCKQESRCFGSRLNRLNSQLTLIIPAALQPWTQPLREISTVDIPGGKGQAIGP
jgi:hypothetical protein